MMDDLGLIHMNGRIYDPLTGLSADQVIQSPLNLQSYNRYSYCMNNPAGYVDPSGYVKVWTSTHEVNRTVSIDVIRMLVSSKDVAVHVDGDVVYGKSNLYKMYVLTADVTIEVKVETHVDSLSLKGLRGHWGVDVGIKDGTGRIDLNSRIDTEFIADTVNDSGGNNQKDNTSDGHAIGVFLSGCEDDPWNAIADAAYTSEKKDAIVKEMSQDIQKMNEVVDLKDKAMELKDKVEEVIDVIKIYEERRIQ